MTKIAFLGTKGEIEESSRKHQYHSSLLLTYRKFKLQIDYGALHRLDITETGAKALLITHAHPDHYFWLDHNTQTDIPVYLTQETLDYGKYQPANPQVIKPGTPFTVGPFRITAYRAIHSLRCPAVGYKIKTPERTVLVYNPDLVDIVEKDNILKGVDYYIGDGSAIKANLVRRTGNKLFGHTRITTQINWCKDRSIENIFFTHLGKETIREEKSFRKEHPEAVLAHDGMALQIQRGRKDYLTEM